MNIFALDESPALAARFHCDRHVVKMILETGQLLCTAHHILDGADSPIADILYKPTHANHPCSVWVRQTHRNYIWTFELFELLHSEWKHRWNHHDVNHKTYNRLVGYADLNISDYPKNIPQGPRQPFVQCMPDIYKIPGTPGTVDQYYQPDWSDGDSLAGLAFSGTPGTPGDPVQAYRDYYAGAKKDLLKYTKRARPFWLIDNQDVMMGAEK